MSNQRKREVYHRKLSNEIHQWHESSIEHYRLRQIDVGKSEWPELWAEFEAEAEALAQRKQIPMDVARGAIMAAIMGTRRQLREEGEV